MAEEAPQRLKATVTDNPVRFGVSFVPVAGWIAEHIGRETTFSELLTPFHLATLLMVLGPPLYTFFIQRQQRRRTIEERVLVEKVAKAQDAVEVAKEVVAEAEQAVAVEAAKEEKKP